MELPKNVLQKVYLISFLDLFAVGLTFPVLAPYIRSLDASHLTVGILSSAYSALQVLAGPVIGSWSDIRGRKSVFIITLILSSICYFCLGFCTSIYAIFITRLLLGVVKHTQTLVKAIVVDYVGSNSNTNIFGRIAAFSSLGFVIGPIISGHLSDFKNGFLYICTLTSVLFVCNTWLVFKLPDVPKSGKTPSGTPTQFSVFANVKNELWKSVQNLKKVNWLKYWVSFSLKFFFVLSTTIFFVNQSLYLKEKYNLNQKYVGYSISLISIIGMFSAFFLGPIRTKFYKNDNRSMHWALHCFIILTICFVGFYFAPNFYVLAVLLVPFGVCNAVLRVVTMEMMFDECDNEERGSLTGASDSVMSLARFAAPLTAGIISDIFNENSVMIYAMMPALIGTIICYLQIFKNDIVKDKLK